MRCSIGKTLAMRRWTWTSSAWLSDCQKYYHWLVSRSIIPSQSTGGLPSPPHFNSSYMWCFCLPLRNEVAYILFGNKDRRSDLKPRKKLQRPIGYLGFGFDFGFVALAKILHGVEHGGHADGAGAVVGDLLRWWQFAAMLSFTRIDWATAVLWSRPGVVVSAHDLINDFKTLLPSSSLFRVSSAFSQ